MLGSNKVTCFVCTTDYKRARAFYEEILGLKFVSEDQFAMVLNANGTMLRIARFPDLKPAPFTVLGWETSKIETQVSELEKRGVQFERYPWMAESGMAIWTAPTGDKVAWFKDPDGNVLSLSQHV